MIQIVSLASIKLNKADDYFLRLDSDVEDLMQSIAAVGLINPLIVTEDLELVCGGRRYTALKRLQAEGRMGDEIPVLCYEMDSIDTQIMAIDDNVVRRELHGRMLADALSTRKRLYLIKHPETEEGKAQALATNRKLGHDVSAESAPTFVQDTAEKTGMGTRIIHQNIARGEKAIPEVKDAWERGDIGDTQVDELIKVAPEEQKKILPAVIGKDIQSTKDIVRQTKTAGAEVALDVQEQLELGNKLFKKLQNGLKNASDAVDEIEREKFNYSGWPIAKMSIEFCLFSSRMKQFLNISEEKTTGYEHNLAISNSNESLTI